MPQQLFFTKAAALRILPFATKIEAIRVFKGAVQVTYLTKNGRCSTFLSKTAFYSDFITFRQEGAKGCTVKRWGAGSYQCRYDVKSGNGEKIYVVELSAGTAMCDCPDFEEQRKQLGKAKVGCKHVLATLSHVGYSSLAEYMDAMERKATADLFGEEWNAPTQHLIEPHGDFIDDINQEARSLQLASTKNHQQKKQRDPFGGFSF